MDGMVNLFNVVFLIVNVNSFQGLNGINKEGKVASVDCLQVGTLLTFSSNLQVAMDKNGNVRYVSLPGSSSCKAVLSQIFLTCEEKAIYFEVNFP